MTNDQKHAVYIHDSCHSYKCMHVSFVMCSQTSANGLTGTSHKRTTQYGSGNFSNKTQLTSRKRAPVVSEWGHPFRGHGTKITSLIRTVEEKIAKL